MEFRILGPLEVRVDGRVVDVGGAKQRALLAVLLLNANRVVSTDHLIEALWAERPPGTAPKVIQVYVSGLRKSLGRDRILTKAPGYEIRVEPGELDLDRAQKLVAENRPADALSLWRGQPLADFSYEPFAQSEIARLEELRLGVLEARLEGDLERGRHSLLVGELEALVRDHPLRERFSRQLMLALYRSGRQAEALDVYHRARQNSVEQLGIEPGPALRELERKILNQDESLGSPPDQGQPTRAPPLPRVAYLGVVIVLALTVPIVAFLALRGDSALTTVAANGVGIADGGKLVAAGSMSGAPTEVASGASSVWVTSTDDQTVARIDPATGDVRETIKTGSGASGVAADEHGVWVTNSLDGNVTRIDPKANAAVDTIDVGAGPVAVALGNTSVWVANRNGQTVWRLDDRTGDVRARIPVGPGPRAVAVDTRAVWVADEVRNALYRVDPRQNSVVDVINVGTGPTSVAIGFGSVWVANNLDGTVSRVDPARDAVAETISVGDGPRSLAAGRDGIWVSNEFDGTLRMIDPDTNGVTRTIHVGERPVAVAAVGRRIAVAVRAAGAAHRGGTLRGVLSIPAFSGSIDTTNYAAVHATMHTNDGLVAFRQAGGVDGSQLVPDLAVALPTPTDGGRTYTFRIRPGIRYSNGQVVRPKDFRRAFERLFLNGRDPIFYGAILGAERCVVNAGKQWEALTKRLGSARGARAYFANVRCDLSHGIVTSDASQTVTFHLRSPDPAFLYKLAVPIVSAVPAETPTRDSGSRALPATGPYMVSSFRPRRELVFTRNPNFHEWSKAARPDGYPDRLVTTLVPSAVKAVEGVETGRADIALEGVPPELQHEAETQYASLVHVNPVSAVTYLFLNTRVRPFDDVRVRRAVNYAVDRAAGIRVSARGVGADPTCQILPPDFPGYSRFCPFAPGNVWREPDLPRAQRLVAASGTRGALVTVWVPDNHAKEAPFARALFRSLGYRVRLKRVSDDVYYFNHPVSGPLDPARRAQAGPFSWFADYPAASNYMTTFFACDSPSNWSHFCDRHIDAQIHHAVALETTDPYLANQLWAKVDREIVANAPVVPLFTLKNVDIVSQRVGNYQYNPQWGVLVDQLWVR